MSAYPASAHPGHAGHPGHARPPPPPHAGIPVMHRSAVPQHAQPAQPAAGYTRAPFNPQFQRTVHSAQNALPKTGAPPPAPGPGGPGGPVPAGRAPQPSVAGYAHQQAQVQAQAISSRIASTNAAISAIQSVTPPVIRPVPRNRPAMSLAGLPQLPGGDIKGTVKYDPEDGGIEVVDEVTAQKSAANFSQFLGRVRKQRNKRWDAYWRHRTNLNRQILLEENECFKEAQEDANDYEGSDDDGPPRRSKPIIVPYIYHNVGSFDIPRPPSVVMPDPEMITLRLQAQQSVQAQQAQQVQQAQQAQQAQQIQLMQRQQMSARQRAAQHIKQNGRGY